MPETKWLRAGIAGKPDAIDREAKIIRGFVVAQLGPFKSQGRGEFDQKSLDQIQRLGNAAPKGLKSRLGHPTMSDDGIGKLLGRARDFRMGTARDARTGKSVPAVRANLHFSESASKTPSGDLAGYVLDLADEDPEALSSSLVLEVDEEYRLEKDGTPKRGDAGEELPPLWRPTRLHASDIVDTGDAVDALLTPEEFTRALSMPMTPDLQRALNFDGVARLATQMLDGLFGGKDREMVNAKCQAWLDRYLSMRFGEEEEPDLPRFDAVALRLEEMGLKVRKMRNE